MKRQKTRTQREELGLALRALAVLRTHVRYSYSLHPQDGATAAAECAQRELTTAEKWIRAALKAANKRDEQRHTREAA